MKGFSSQELGPHWTASKWTQTKETRGTSAAVSPAPRDCIFPARQQKGPVGNAIAGETCCCPSDLCRPDISDERKGLHGTTHGKASVKVALPVKTASLSPIIPIAALYSLAAEHCASL